MVLLDIMLPVMDGWARVRRTSARQGKTPIIMLTAKGDVDDQDHRPGNGRGRLYRQAL